jgi:nucleotide-binding universal stress UspA family protein
LRILFAAEPTGEDGKGAQAVVGEMKSQAAREGILAGEVVKEGRPYEIIAGTAKESAATLIVMGRRVRGATRPFLPRGVAEQVVSYSDCPVLVVE